MKKQHVKLSEEDRAYLEGLVSKGEIKARVFRRALGLLELDRGKTFTEVAKTLQKSIMTVSNWAAQYKEQGLVLLEDRARAGRPIVIDGNQRAMITALAGEYAMRCPPLALPEPGRRTPPEELA